MTLTPGKTLIKRYKISIPKNVDISSALFTLKFSMSILKLIVKRSPDIKVNDIKWYDKWLCRKPLLSGRPGPEDVEDGGLNGFCKFWIRSSEWKNFSQNRANQITWKVLYGNNVPRPFERTSLTCSLLTILFQHLDVTPLPRFWSTNRYQYLSAILYRSHWKRIFIFDTYAFTAKYSWFDYEPW